MKANWCMTESRQNRLLHDESELVYDRIKTKLRTTQKDMQSSLRDKCALRPSKSETRNINSCLSVLRDYFYTGYRQSVEIMNAPCLVEADFLTHRLVESAL